MKILKLSIALLAVILLMVVPALTIFTKSLHVSAESIILVSPKHIASDHPPEVGKGGFFVIYYRDEHDSHMAIKVPRDKLKNYRGGEEKVYLTAIKFHNSFFDKPFEGVDIADVDQVDLFLGEDEEPLFNGTLRALDSRDEPNDTIIQIYSCY